MNQLGRSVLWIVLVLVAGVATQRLWGARPPAGSTTATAGEAWAVPAKFSLDLEPTEAVWTTRGPWGLPPKPAPELPPPPPPPPMPVGIVTVRGGYEALFLVAGTGEVRLRAGDKLPGGGRVTAVNRFRVGWIDRDGKKQEHELFGDPVPQPPPSGT